MTLEEMLALAPVVPVLTIAEEDKAVPLARALVAGGLRMLEVTLRTPAAEGAIRRIAEEVQDAVVGAGTALNPADVERARRAGARFVVSPGLMAEARPDGEVPLLPGVATATEVMDALARGFHLLKLFPAVPVGGVDLLKSFAPVFPKARFCPTGGVSLQNAGDFLALPNVICIGGSWITPADAVRAGDWARIEQLARACQSLRR
jgi:2-dehydro-3-deoxyphosphogluconate aldolase/(4S)-4-hydroxy-2-oxoglutarate aldolase